MRISDWSSDVCSSDLAGAATQQATQAAQGAIGEARNAMATATQAAGSAANGALQQAQQAAQQAVEQAGQAASISRAWSIASLAPASASRSEEPTSELQSLMRISYAVFCLKKKNTHKQDTHHDLT